MNVFVKLGKIGHGEAKGAFQEFGGMITEKELEFAKHRQDQRNA